MFPALKKILFATLFWTTCCSAAQIPGTAGFADHTPIFTSIRYAVSHAPRSPMSDPIESELGRLGSRGQVVAETRFSVISILSADSACSNWYRQSVPDPAEVFRSLHFVVDLSGNAEIVKRESAYGNAEYLHPYVAHSRQQEGADSEITLNANGAFFKDSARIRYSTTPPAYMDQLVRPLVVGDFSGDTPQARTLTLLHEFAHVVGLLPVDSGTPSAAFLSVQNTKAVLKNCKSQIELEARQTREGPLRFLSAAATPPQQNHAFFAPMRGHSAIPPRQ